MQYNFKEVEEKWSNYWLNNKVYKKMNDNYRPRFFVLDDYILTNTKNISLENYINIIKNDAYSRLKRMQGYNVMHTSFFNSFGLDGEKYAIKTGNSPFDYSKKNMNNKLNLLKRLGISYDYDLSINSSDPDYYKWSQWLFTKLYEKGLAKLKDIDIYYCDALKRIVEKEETIIIDGSIKTIKDNFNVKKRSAKYWFIDISSYNERILKDIYNLDYPPNLIDEINKIIGRKEGYNLKMRIDGSNLVFNSFTNRVDNLFGATFCVISKNNKKVLDITTEDEYNDVINYLNDETISKDKVGVFTGAFAINPVNAKLLPIWVSNYISDEYDNGFKVCTPSTDVDDYQFANIYGLDIIKVIDFEEMPYFDSGILTNSGFLDGLYSDEANQKAINYLIENGYGERIIDYKLREIKISSPLYFGEPIPIIYLNDGSIKVLNSTELPLESPNILVKNTGTIYSPLYNAKNWVNVYTKEGIEGVRELNTLNNLQGISWFFLAFVLESKAGILPINSPDAKMELNKWLPVDLYLTKTKALDIIYQKFMTYVLSDLDYINVSEPFKRVIDGSINFNEEINFDIVDFLDNFGSDCLRLFLLDLNNDFNLTELDNYRKYINRLIKLFEAELNVEIPISDSFKKLEIDVTNCYNEFDYKGVIYLIGNKVNEYLKEKQISKKEASILLKLLNPICPFITEELYSEFITKKNILSFEEWPIMD